MAENYSIGPYTFFFMSLIIPIMFSTSHCVSEVRSKMHQRVPAVVFILVQRFHMCAPDTQHCSWLSVVILSWYAGVGSGAELPGLCLQHTQTRTAPQQLRHQGKGHSSWWVEFRTSVWLFLFVFVGVVWDYLFIHFCSDFFLLLFFELIESVEWLAGLNTYHMPQLCVRSHTFSFSINHI